MRKTSTWLLEQGTQTPSPAPDLIPAETRTENSHWDWYRKRGHFRRLILRWLCMRVGKPKEWREGQKEIKWLAVLTIAVVRLHDTAYDAQKPLWALDGAP